MHDTDVALIRHFLAQAASELNLKVIQDSILRWSEMGPGVWFDIDLNILIGQANVFDQAKVCVNRLEPVISVDYLNSKISDGWQKGIPCSHIVERLRELAILVAAAQHGGPAETTAGENSPLPPR